MPGLVENTNPGVPPCGAPRGPGAAPREASQGATSAGVIHAGAETSWVPEEIGEVSVGTSLNARTQRSCQVAPAYWWCRTPPPMTPHPSRGSSGLGAAMGPALLSSHFPSAVLVTQRAVSGWRGARGGPREARSLATPRVALRVWPSLM